MFGWQELLLIFLILLLIFGGKKLPELARSLGKSVGAFKDAADGKEPKPKKNAKK